MEKSCLFINVVREDKYDGNFGSNKMVYELSALGIGVLNVLQTPYAEFAVCCNKSNHVNKNVTKLASAAVDGR
jgi:hypothetical protein